MTPQQELVLGWLEHYGDKGMTVYESILNGCGTELRRHLTTIKRMGYPITSKWETRNGKHYKRYYYLGE
jgi:hypothetical protein